MVMASLFESFAQPFTIMFSVPFAFIGVGIIMTLAGQARSSSSDMGLIILAGIVVNNAIVLVDHINRLRRQGLPRDEAIVLGGRHRLRPILMTAITTVLGLSPMVAGYFLPSVFGAPDGRAAFWAPVGLVILGGLTTSTFLTVMVIPTVYSLIDDLRSSSAVSSQPPSRRLPVRAPFPCPCPTEIHQHSQHSPEESMKHTLAILSPSLSSPSPPAAAPTTPAALAEAAADPLGWAARRAAARLRPRSRSGCSRCRGDPSPRTWKPTAPSRPRTRWTSSPAPPGR